MTDSGKLTLRQVLDICRAKANWISDEVERLKCPSELQEQAVDLYMLLADTMDPHGLDGIVIDDKMLRTWMRTVPVDPGDMDEVTEQEYPDMAKGAKGV